MKQKKQQIKYTVNSGISKAIRTLGNNQAYLDQGPAFHQFKNRSVLGRGFLLYLVILE